MKTEKIIYWTSTAVIACLLLYSSLLYLTNIEMQQAIAHLGFPGYFRIELALCQLIAFCVLVFSFQHRYLKVIAYAGVLLILISAMIAHGCVGDPVTVMLMPFLATLIHLTSFYYYIRLRPDRHGKD